MGRVLNVTINPDIKLDESKIKKMPYDLKQYLLITITIAMERYECDWTELTWSIKFYDNQPVINVKKRM